MRHRFEETAHHGWIRSSRPSVELNNAWFRPSAHGVVAEMRRLAQTRRWVNPPSSVGVAVTCRCTRQNGSALPMGTTAVAKSWPR